MKNFLFLVTIVMSFCIQNAHAQSSNKYDPNFLLSRVTIESAPVIVLDANENIIDKTYGKLRIWTDNSDPNRYQSLVFFLEGLSSPKVKDMYFLTFDKSSKCTRRGSITKDNDVLELSTQFSDGDQTLAGLVSSPIDGAPSGYNGQLYIALVNPQGNLEYQLVVALTWDQYIHALIYVMKEVKDKGLVPFTQY